MPGRPPRLRGSGPTRLTVRPPLPLGVHLRRPTASLPFPLGRPDCSLFSLGRHALWHGLHAHGLAPGDRVLVPAHHRGPEVEVLLRMSLQCDVYRQTPELAPAVEDVDRLVQPETRALYLRHDNGFAQDAASWRGWCDERGLLLVEDAGEAWLSRREERPVGSVGDLAVFCLYDTFGVPDGAALVSTSATAALVRRSHAGVGPLLLRHAAWLAQRSGMAARLAGGHGEPRELDLALGDPSVAPSSLSLHVLPRVVDERAASRRRSNYRVLLDQLGEEVLEPYGQLPDGTCPHAFPLRVADEPARLERLARAGVVAHSLPAAPHPALDAARFPELVARPASSLALPVHQELTSGDLERLVDAAKPRARPRRELRVERLAGLTDAEAEWDVLAEASRNVFATREWATIWWRHFGAGRPLLAAVLRRPGGAPLAVLPLYLASTRPLRIVRFVGHGPGDVLGPVCRPGDRRVAMRELRRALDELSPGWDVLLAEQLPGEEEWAAVIGGRVVARDGLPVLHAPERGWDAFLAQRSSNFREQVRRRERVLARAHPIAYRLVTDGSSLQDDLDTLFRLHRARWEGAPTEFLAGGREAFHREFAEQALRCGWLRLWFLEVAGEPVAAWYGFRFGATESFYQAGRDPEWDRYSVGFLLMAHTIRSALGDGLREYRLLRGDEPYKGRFATHDDGAQTLAVARGAPGNAAVASAMGLRRLSRRGAGLVNRAAG